MKSQLNLDRLRVEIRDMTRTHALYKLLKEELTKLGYWRSKPRGNPAKGYKAMRDKDEA